MSIRHRFTTDEYERMVETGILTPDDRVELLQGEVVRMAPIGTRHAECVRRLARALFRGLGDEAIVSIQSPVRIDDSSMPEPDVAVLRVRPRGYADAHPQPPDVLLVIEVADTSVERDRTLKIPLYAAAGIAEAWLVDLLDDEVQVHRDPAPGGYRETRRSSHGTLAVSGVSADVRVEIDEILP